MPWTPKVWRSEVNPLGPPAAGPATTLSGPAITAEFQAAHDYVDTLSSPVGGPHMFVDATHGADINDGLSWGRAKATLAAAVTATPTGGLIDIAAGQYGAPGTLNGHYIRGPLFHGGDSAKGAVIQHTVNGDMFSFAAGSQGGGLENLYINQNGSFTGTAIKAASSAGAASGYFTFKNLVLSGGSGWERNVWLDGSANAIGIRDIFFENCLFFGTTTSGENVLINKASHIYFTACDLVLAPTVVQQGVKILNSFSDDIQWIGKVLGDVYSEAGSNAVGGGVWFFGRITGTITCAVGSHSNKFRGVFDSSVSFVNNGDPLNNIVEGYPSWQAPTLLNSWANSGGGYTTAGYSVDLNRHVHLKGRITGGTKTPNTILFTLPAGFRPAEVFNFLVFAINGAGALTPCYVTVNSGGDVAIQTDLSGGGAAFVGLDSIPPFPLA